ncbi:hypothetical protein FHW84_001044 [Dyella sp. SG562]|uniref:hypothetical protein n=1 Tax=Dyella sp. SG562 TaxID=2587017 RepID=UPI00142113D4|nr:hypothetical protein [Dyella sp. SG562]NII72478.1 hypothetical protein [Dyella sp. SG562]
MGIQKQEFYEGAAIYQLIRKSGATHISYAPPLFVFDNRLQIHLKYSTGKRSPWGFTFMPDEQAFLRKSAQSMRLIIGLICGADGIAALSYDDYASIASIQSNALRVSCKRNHRAHFEIGGPDGTLPGKVAPADWSNLLDKS